MQPGMRKFLCTWLELFACEQGIWQNFFDKCQTPTPCTASPHPLPCQLYIDRYIEDITWLHGDKKFLFECWKLFHKWVIWTSEIVFNTRREISYLQTTILCSIYYINTNEITNHFTLIVFWRERCDLLCSHSNRDIFTCEDIKFPHESSLGNSLVFLY